MPINWSTTTLQVNLEELIKVRKRLCDEYEKESIQRALANQVFTPIPPIEFKWMEPPVPQVEQERLDAMKFRVFTDMSYRMFGVPKHVLFGCDVGNVDATFVAYEVPKPKNNWLRIAALVAAAIVFVLIWSMK